MNRYNFLSIILLTSSIVLSGCNNSSKNSENSSTSDGNGSSDIIRKSTFELKDKRVEVDNQGHLDSLVAYNDFGTDESIPEISLDTSIKKFGEASIKVVNKHDSSFNSDNSWPSVELPFDLPQDFSKTIYTQFNVYSPESEPFILDIQYNAFNSNIYKSNFRQINPGWNVIEVVNNNSRDFSIPEDFRKIHSFVFAVWGNAKKDCTYYFDDITISDDPVEFEVEDVHELISLKKTSYYESRGSNCLVPFSLLEDATPDWPSIKQLTDNEELIITQENEWHFLIFNSFNNHVFDYDSFAVDFENIDDKPIDVGIAAQGGDYQDGGTRFYPSNTMVRRRLLPGEKATIELPLADVENILNNLGLTEEYLSHFIIFSYDSEQNTRTYKISNISLVTAHGLDIMYAQKVIKMINELPKLEDITKNDDSLIATCRIAYDSLTEEQKALVTNYQTLVAAEEKLNEIIGNLSAAELINRIKETGSLTGLDITYIVKAREKYNALSDEEKEAITNVNKLVEAEKNMLRVKTWNSEESIADFKCGVYFTDNAAITKTGYVDEIGGRSGGFAWASSEVGNPDVNMDDENGDGYYNDRAYWARTQIIPLHDKSAYQALYANGYRKISFDIYQECSAGSFAYWNSIGTPRWGRVSSNEWHTFTIDLKHLIDGFASIKDGHDGTMFAFDFNKDATLTKVYISDIVVS